MAKGRDTFHSLLSLQWQAVTDPPYPAVLSLRGPPGNPSRASPLFLFQAWCAGQDLVFYTKESSLTTLFNNLQQPWHIYYINTPFRKKLRIFCLLQHRFIRRGSTTTKHTPCYVFQNMRFPSVFLLCQAVQLWKWHPASKMLHIYQGSNNTSAE